MTVAICYKCGEFKFGAFNPCQRCGTLPKSEDDFALSLAMTDHYFDKSTLDTMSADVKRGKPLRLDPKTRENLVAEIRNFPDLLRRNNPETRKPWWKSMFKLFKRKAPNLKLHTMPKAQSSRILVHSGSIQTARQVSLAGTPSDFPASKR